MLFTACNMLTRMKRILENYYIYQVKAQKTVRTVVVAAVSLKILDIPLHDEYIIVFHCVYIIMILFVRGKE